MSNNDTDCRLITSRSIMSLGKGTSGFSPVSTVGMLAFLISFSTNPVQQRESIIQYLHLGGLNPTGAIKYQRMKLDWLIGRNYTVPLGLSVDLSHYLLSFLSISSHRLTSFTNLRWNTFTSGFSCGCTNKIIYKMILTCSCLLWLGRKLGSHVAEIK